MARWLTCVAASIALCLFAGCAATARQIAREAAPGGIEGSIAALSHPDNQQRIGELLDNPGLEKAGRRVARGVVAGALEVIAENDVAGTSILHDSQFRLGTTHPTTGPAALEVNQVEGAYGDTTAAASTTAPTTEMAPSTQPTTRPSIKLSAAVRETELWAYGMIRSATKDGIRDALNDPGPGLQGLTDQIIDAGLDHITSAGGDKLGPIIQSAITDNVGPGIGAAIRKDIGPALREMLKEDVGPGLRDMIRQEIRPALGLEPGTDLKGHIDKISADVSRSVSREAVLGVDDALRQLDERQKQGKPVSGLLGRTQGAIENGLDLARVLAIALGLLVVVMGIWLSIVLSKTRRIRSEAVRRDASANRLAEAIRAAADRPWAGELRSLLQERLGSQKDADEVFGKKP